MGQGLVCSFHAWKAQEIGSTLVEAKLKNWVFAKTENFSSFLHGEKPSPCNKPTNNKLPKKYTHTSTRLDSSRVINRLPVFFIFLVVISGLFLKPERRLHGLMESIRVMDCLKTQPQTSSEYRHFRHGGRRHVRANRLSYEQPASAYDRN